LFFVLLCYGLLLVVPSETPPPLRASFANKWRNLNPPNAALPRKQKRAKTKPQQMQAVQGGIGQTHQW
jgi:hypothetical protein